MIGGNANADGTVDINDLINTWQSVVGQSGYLQGDFNMDGKIQNQDKNDIWYPNINAQTQLPE